MVSMAFVTIECGQEVQGSNPKKTLYSKAQQGSYDSPTSSFGIISQLSEPMNVNERHL